MKPDDGYPITSIPKENAVAAGSRSHNGLKEVASGIPCRACGAALRYIFVDLGMTPLCETYITRQELNDVEYFYPLHVYVCDQCYLAQLEEYVPVESIFSEYAYFSSYADTWVEHARRYVAMVAERFGLGKESQVVEIASNDGYLLQHFLPRGIPSLGIEPAANIAKVATANGIPTLVKFFNQRTARDLVDGGIQADLLIGNNVLGQAPELNDFVAGMKLLLKPQGVITMEFAYLLELMRQNQFDTIYHEHFTYFAFLTVERVFARHGIVLFDVEVLPTHGGSLRIYGRHAEDETKPVTARAEALRSVEQAAGLERLDSYASFSKQVQETKRQLLEFLIAAQRAGKQVVGYGAPGKGNTLLNYCGIRTDFLDYTVDRNPYKQGRFLPGTLIPIFPPEKIRETKPDYVLILPWNLKDEIMKQVGYIREWGGQFVVPIPELQIYDPADSLSATGRRNLAKRNGHVGEPDNRTQKAPAWGKVGTGVGP
jgi:C-methyltransferase C-terminal domain/Putative zinc binding domain/Methyltransferase domain